MMVAGQLHYCEVHNFKDNHNRIFELMTGFAKTLGLNQSYH